MSVVDRWHKSRPMAGEPVCKDHGRVPTKDHGKGERWQVRWRDENGEQRARQFERKSAADSFDAEIKSKLDMGTSLDLAAGRERVKDAATRWRADLLHRESTGERLDRVFRLHIDPILGHLRMSQVRPSHVRAWVKNRSEVLAPSTLAVVYSNLASFFAAAVIDRTIGVSPCAGVRLPEIERHSHFIPTPEQVHALADALPGRFRAMVYLAAGCGLRGGEIMGMELDAVDFLRREVDVSQQLVAVTGRKPYLGPPKTKTSARTVELPEVASMALARHLEAYGAVEVEIDDQTDPRKPVHRTAKLLFTLPTLNPIHRSTWSHFWSPAARDVGIPKGMGLHCLRHYFATLLIHHGASVKTVQMALGHSTPMITLNTYVGEWPEAQERTRSIVDSALGNVHPMCTAKIEAL
ncbi:tyrosine-type recombinase/integrase [Microbispora bryophytorum]|uniref:tyrosine-type recombinase/integrase n=1 Tax=Microbispora bryophytorum TaxID=1460882 RepID=UPI0033DC8A59